jgi:tetratricopeptide (TPR) repeat protein
VIICRFTTKDLAMTIFLSYSWSNKEQAEYINNILSTLGISIRRDITVLSYKDDLRNFMRQIRECDYSIILVSDDYLKSPNCLYELSELFKDSNYTDKVLPIIIDGTKIYSIDDKANLIRFWNDKCKETQKILSDLNPVNSINLLQELKIYTQIYGVIDELIDSITRRLNVNLSAAKKNNFSELLIFIGYEKDSIQSEILSAKKIDDSQVKELALEKLLKKYPNNIDIFFAIGYLNLTDLKNYYKAIDYFLEILSLQENHSHIVYNNLGLSYFYIGNLELAAKYYNKGLRINKDCYELYYNLANLEAEKKNYGIAKELFIKTTQLNYPDPEVFYNIGNICVEHENKLKEAKQYYYKAIELQVNFYPAYNNLATIYIREQNYHKAIAVLDKGLKYCPDEPMILYNLAVLEFHYRKNFRLAKQYFRNCIRLDNNYISPKIGLAKMLVLNFGDIAEAKELILDALKIEPANDDVLIHLSMIYQLEGDMNKAAEYKEKAFKINPNLNTKIKW